VQENAGDGPVRRDKGDAEEMTLSLGEEGHACDDGGVDRARVLSYSMFLILYCHFIFHILRYMCA
jgi:hypothetical protein